MLVKRADLPKFSAAIVKKQIQQKKEYPKQIYNMNPLQLGFHDDNLGITSVP